MAELEQTLDSTEIADMINKEHSKLLRDIRRYVEQFNEAKIGFVDFFKESTYKDAKGEIRPCYRVTKKGCEFIAHKLTGTKGTIFTARYINRFHEMEDKIKSIPATGQRKVTFLQEIKAAAHVAKGMTKNQQIELYKAIYERHGLRFGIEPEKGIEDKKNSDSIKYKKETMDIINKICSERRIVQIYTMSKKLLEFEQK